MDDNTLRNHYIPSSLAFYRIALLSNSFVGARSREQEHYHFAEMTDLIIYSHEVGLPNLAGAFSN